MTTLPHNSLLFFFVCVCSFCCCFFSFLSFTHSFWVVSIFVDKFITKLLTIDTGFWSKFQRIISENGTQFKSKGREEKNSLYRFILWTAVNIYKTEYTSCCRSLLPPLWIWITRLFVQKCSWADVCIVYDGLVPISNKRDLTQNFICKNYSFLVMFCI